MFFVIEKKFKACLPGRAGYKSLEYVELECSKVQNLHAPGMDQKGKIKIDIKV